MSSGQRRLRGPRGEWIAFHIRHTAAGREESADILLFGSKRKFIFLFTSVQEIQGVYVVGYSEYAS